MSTTITLGRHELPVVPQSLPRLKRDISALAAKIPTLTDDFKDMSDMAEVMALMGDAATEFSYEAVCVLIPLVARRIPAYEWGGYASQAAADLDDHDDEDALDAAPNVVQIREALRVGIEVNGLEFLGKLKGLDLGSVLSGI